MAHVLNKFGFANTRGPRIGHCNICDTLGPLTEDQGADQIGVRVGRVINKYKVAKHFELTIEAQRLAFRIRADAVAKEAALDGLYIVRTPLAATKMDAPEVVRSYKSLSDVERAFRCLKSVDLKVRPIHHRLAERVRSHIFLCMRAYYVCARLGARSCSPMKINRPRPSAIRSPPPSVPRPQHTRRSPTP